MRKVSLSVHNTLILCLLNDATAKWAFPSISFSPCDTLVTMDGGQKMVHSTNLFVNGRRCPSVAYLEKGALEQSGISYFAILYNRVLKPCASFSTKRLS